MLLQMIRGPYRTKYVPAQMTQALSAVAGGMGVKTASRKFGIPKTSLLDRVKGRVNVEILRSGPPAVLTEAEEKVLVQHVINCGKMGYPLDKKDLKRLVCDIILEDGRPNPFKENRPGNKNDRCFYGAFLVNK